MLIIAERVKRQAFTNSCPDRDLILPGDRQAGFEVGIRKGPSDPDGPMLKTRRPD